MIFSYNFRIPTPSYSRLSGIILIYDNISFSAALQRRNLSSEMIGFRSSAAMFTQEKPMIPSREEDTPEYTYTYYTHSPPLAPLSMSFFQEPNDFRTARRCCTQKFASLHRAFRSSLIENLLDSRSSYVVGGRQLFTTEEGLFVTA